MTYDEIWSKWEELREIIGSADMPLVAIADLYTEISQDAEGAAEVLRDAAKSGEE